jgi:hypothetical protein
VEEGVWGVTLSRRTLFVIIGVVVIFAIALIAGVVAGVSQNPPLGSKPQGGTEALSAVAWWSNLGLGALVGALVGVVGTYWLREQAQAKRETRELQGLLRMLYVEIEENKGTAELLLGVEKLKPGYWTDTVYKDDTWKEVRARLAQLLPDADHFNQMTAYYARNENHEKGILRVIEIGSSLYDPDNALAKLMRDETMTQIALAVDALEMVKEYIGDAPVDRESLENAAQEMERLQRELDAERYGREQGQ